MTPRDNFILNSASGQNGPGLKSANGWDIQVGTYRTIEYDGLRADQTSQSRMLRPTEHTSSATPRIATRTGLKATLMSMPHPPKASSKCPKYTDRSLPYVLTRLSLRLLRNSDCHSVTDCQPSIATPEDSNYERIRPGF